MQSPPASAEATSVGSLSPVLAAPARRRVEVTVDELPQAQVPGEGGRQEQAGIGHQAVAVERGTDAVRLAAW